MQQKCVFFLSKNSNSCQHSVQFSAKTFQSSVRRVYNREHSSLLQWSVFCEKWKIIGELNGSVTDNYSPCIFSPIDSIIIKRTLFGYVGGKSMIGELLRKSIHLSGLTIPIIYLFLEKPTMLVIIGILTGFALTVELVKWLSPDFGAFFFPNFHPAPPKARA